MGKTINRLDLLLKVRRPIPKPDQRFGDKTKYTRKIKHKERSSS